MSGRGLEGLPRRVAPQSSRGRESTHDGVRGTHSSRLRAPGRHVDREITRTVFRTWNRALTSVAQSVRNLRAARCAAVLRHAIPADHWVRDPKPRGPPGAGPAARPRPTTRRPRSLVEAGRLSRPRRRARVPPTLPRPTRTVCARSQDFHARRASRPTARLTLQFSRDLDQCVDTNQTYCRSRAPSTWRAVMSSPSRVASARLVASSACV